MAVRNVLQAVFEPEIATGYLLYTLRAVRAAGTLTLHCGSKWGTLASCLGVQAELKMLTLIPRLCTVHVWPCSPSYLTLLPSQMFISHSNSVVFAWFSAGECPWHKQLQRFGGSCCFHLQRSRMKIWEEKHWC